MATQKKPLSIKSSTDNTPERTVSAEELQAEYRRRQRSARPLPASVAKAYEVLISRQELSQELSQEPSKDAVNS